MFVSLLHRKLGAIDSNMASTSSLNHLGPQHPHLSNERFEYMIVFQLWHLKKA